MVLSAFTSVTKNDAGRIRDGLRRLACSRSQDDDDGDYAPACLRTPKGI